MAFSDILPIEEKNKLVVETIKQITPAETSQIPVFSEITFNNFIQTSEMKNSSKTPIFRSYEPLDAENLIKEIRIWRDIWTDSIRTIRIKGFNERGLYSLAIRIYTIIPFSKHSEPRIDIEVTYYPELTKWHQQVLKFLKKQEFIQI
ncbi:MAG: hypothetical protein ACFFDT_11545 [Candidatus Hodarchaeota archaeon]